MRDALETARAQVVGAPRRGGAPGGVHLGRHRGDQRRRLGCDPRQAGRTGAVRCGRALGGARRLGPRRAARSARGRQHRPPRPGRAARAPRHGVPAATRPGPLPVGQPRGGNHPAGARGGRRCASRQASPSTSTPRRPAATSSPTSAHWTPTWSASARTSWARCPERAPWWSAGAAASSRCSSAANKSADAGAGWRRCPRSSRSGGSPRPSAADGFLALHDEATTARRFIDAVLGAALAVDGVEIVGPSSRRPAPLARLPRGARRRGRTGADRSRPRRAWRSTRGRPVRRRASSRRPCSRRWAWTRATRSGSAWAGRAPRRTAACSPPPSRVSWTTCAPYGVEVGVLPPVKSAGTGTPADS